MCSDNSILKWRVRSGGSVEELDEVGVDADGGGEDVGEFDHEPAVARAAHLEQASFVAVEGSANDAHGAAKHVVGYFIGGKKAGRSLVAVGHGADEAPHVLVAHGHGLRGAAATGKAVLQGGSLLYERVEMRLGVAHEKQVGNDGHKLAELLFAFLPHAPLHGRVDFYALVPEVGVGAAKGVVTFEVAHDKPLSAKVFTHVAVYV